MANTLQLYFPQLRERQQVLDDIRAKENLKTLYDTWNEEQQDYFLDIVVQLEDGSIANVECQKIGYAFPGSRAACYSADLLLRQYKRVRGEEGKKFSYKNIKKVYSIIFYEQSPKEFHKFPNNNIHRSEQQTDTGVEIDLLQKFIFIPLDIAKRIYHNRGIRNKLEAWFIFLSDDNPDTIMQMLDTYPEFREMYEEICDLCMNTEKVMGMFSKELLELDRNTVQLMIDEMQDEIDGQKVQINEQQQQLQEKDIQLQEKTTQLQEKDTLLQEMNAQLQEKEAIIAKLMAK